MRYESAASWHRTRCRCAGSDPGQGRARGEARQMLRWSLPIRFFWEKESITIVDEAGDEEKHALIAHHDDFSSSHLRRCLRPLLPLYHSQSRIAGSSSWA